MSPYVSSRSLKTDVREVGVSETWDTQTDWEAYQSASNVAISSGIIQLAEDTIPDQSNLHAHYATRLLTGYSDGDSVDPFTDDTGANDASGFGNPTYRENEQNSQPAVEYDGTDDYHNTGYSVDTNGPRSIYLVWRPPGTAVEVAFGSVDTAGDSTRCYIGNNGSGELIYGYGSTNTNGGSFSTGSYAILSFVAGSGSMAVYQNQTQIDSTTYTANGDSGLAQYIGARNLDGSADSFWANNIAEILDYSAAHSDTTRNDVETYLNDKYAVF